MTKKISFISKMRLKHKIVVFTSVLLILSTTATITLLYNQSRIMLEENSYKESKQVVTQLSNYYSEKLSKIIMIDHSIIEDNSFNKSLSNIMWNKNFNYAKEASTIQSLFQKGMIKDRLISSMLIYTPKGVFYDNLHTPIDLENLKTGEYFKNLPMRYNVFWGNAQVDQIFEGGERVIPIIFNIELDGIYDEIYLLINLSEKSLMKQLTDISSVNNANMYLINSDRKIVTKSEEIDFAQELAIGSLNLYENKDGYFQYKDGKNELYINYAQIDINKWTAISVRSYSDLMKKVRSLQEFALIIGGILLLFSTSLAVVLAATVTRPLKRLKRDMEQVQEGDLQTRFTGQTQDEIGKLGAAFNNMLDKIQTLILALEEEKQKTKREEKQKTQAEIKLLQSQINPHFLYNTLDTIYWKSLRPDNHLVGDMIISLSDMLRIGLGKGKGIISVREEIEHVRNYLYLQANVYSEKFDYTIGVAEDVLEYKTVKLLIQPLVENSILHGFNDIDYKGKIRVSVLEADGCIEFIVEDNGSGFDVHRDIDTGFALKNVSQRIALHYGSQGSMEYASEPYVASLVKIRIPIQPKEGEKDV